MVVRSMVHPSSIISRNGGSFRRPGDHVDDAACVGLASARGLPMATADERLAAACRAAGVDLVG
jgi:PIN domain nuclease of toxin-antitoxin system